MQTLSHSFVMRRLHSLLGLWLVVFLVEHLIVNAAAAYDHGLLFVRMVNHLHSIPYLKAIELLLLAIPFLLHGLWGIYRAYQGKLNSFPGPGDKPSLPEYPRNRAFSWQRLTAWFLLLAIAAHVVQMRFWKAPVRVDSHYVVWVTEDPQLAHTVTSLRGAMKVDGTAVEVALPSSGAALLLMMRETFKSPLMVLLYCLLVITSCYHAFNGLWTALLTWGVVVSVRAQLWTRRLTSGLMICTTLLGLISILGTIPKMGYIWGL